MGVCAPALRRRARPACERLDRDHSGARGCATGLVAAAAAGRAERGRDRAGGGDAVGRPRDRGRARAGFHRAARAADLPDLLVRFDPVAAHTFTGRVTALPDIAAHSLRLELTNVGIAATGHRRGDAVAEVIGRGRRTGYAIVAGRDLRSVGSEVLLERGFAQAWGVRLGDTFYVEGLGGSA